MTVGTPPDSRPSTASQLLVAINTLITEVRELQDIFRTGRPIPKGKIRSKPPQ